MSASTDNSEPTIRFANEQGNLIPLEPLPAIYNLHSLRCASYTLLDSGTRGLRKGNLFCPRHRAFSPQNPLFPLQPFIRLRQNSPPLRA